MEIEPAESSSSDATPPSDQVEDTIPVQVDSRIEEKVLLPRSEDLESGEEEEGEILDDPGEEETNAFDSSEIQISFSKEAWDDTELVDAWDQAVAEYQQYRNIKIPDSAVDPILSLHSLSSKQRTRNDKKRSSVEGNGNSFRPNKKSAHQVAASPLRNSTVQEAPAAYAEPENTPFASPEINSPPIPPKDADASEKTEDGERQELLMKMMMSWYYAGYYAGQYAASVSKSS